MSAHLVPAAPSSTATPTRIPAFCMLAAAGPEAARRSDRGGRVRRNRRRPRIPVRRWVAAARQRDRVGRSQPGPDGRDGTGRGDGRGGDDQPFRPRRWPVDDDPGDVTGPASRRRLGAAGGERIRRASTGSSEMKPLRARSPDRPSRVLLPNGSKRKPGDGRWPTESTGCRRGCRRRRSTARAGNA